MICSIPSVFSAAHHEEEDQDGEVEVEGGPVRWQRLAQVHDHAQRLAQRLEEQLRVQQEEGVCHTDMVAIANANRVMDLPRLGVQLPMVTGTNQDQALSR